MNELSIKFMKEVEGEGAKIVQEMSNVSCTEYYLERANGSRVIISHNIYSIIAKYAEGISSKVFPRNDKGIITIQWSR